MALLCLLHVIYTSQCYVTNGSLFMIHMIVNALLLFGLSSWYVYKYDIGSISNWLHLMAYIHGMNLISVFIPWEISDMAFVSDWFLSFYDIRMQINLSICPLPICIFVYTLLYFCDDLALTVTVCLIWSHCGLVLHYPYTI